ncbi:MAG TPA: DUF1854 domain-containing protein [Gemmatimonadales bacterium]|jgi:hypothetical protein|nr:DUF1854 domain-containing protein [Gemmatimonadales bacterium]
MDATLAGRRLVEAVTGRPDALIVEHRPDGRLWAMRAGEARPVVVRRCFPWSEPGRYLSLRDEDDREFALVRDPVELDAGSRAALGAAVVAAGFVFAVTRVLALEEEVELRDWRVETRQGPRSFQTRLDDWPRTMPGGGLLIRDVAGDLYHIADPARLDQRSRELLWAFID